MDNDETNGDVQDDEISEEPTEESSKENSDESSEAANQENTGTLDTGSSEAAETTPDVEASSASFVESSESGNASSEVRELDMIGINNGITLSDNEINLQEGDEYQLLIDVGMGEISWTSSDETIAVVDSEGIVHAIKEGKVLITVTDEDGFSATCVVVVKNAEDAEIATQPDCEPEETQNQTGQNGGIIGIAGLVILAAGIVIFRVRNNKSKKEETEVNEEDQ